jgi:nucleotide-binding universal stress UspA family protein
MESLTDYKGILIGINFDDVSRRAFYAGLQIAARTGASTYVMHVSEPIRAFDFGKKRYVETNETIERLQEGVQARLDELWEERGLEAVDRRKVQVLVRGGKAGPELVETAKVKGVDLIVIGAGHNHTSEHVVRFAPCSVLVVGSPES